MSTTQTEQAVLDAVHLWTLNRGNKEAESQLADAYLAYVMAGEEQKPTPIHVGWRTIVFVRDLPDGRRAYLPRVAIRWSLTTQDVNQALIDLQWNGSNGNHGFAGPSDAKADAIRVSSNIWGKDKKGFFTIFDAIDELHSWGGR